MPKIRKFDDFLKFSEISDSVVLDLIFWDCGQYALQFHKVQIF
jgi:hypothetical protein